ncbi:uncharacterized protein [Macrobrachium rosenbergii]|uniref:uncharacterized protein n=1 Tax=Macrobrachium rosenbergii TaxID=79674 RepID=UPI0034D39541
MQLAERTFISPVRLQTPVIVGGQPVWSVTLVLLRQRPASLCLSSPAGQSRATLSIKLPPFAQGNPSAWLYRVESQFRIADLNDEVLQADIVLNALPEEIYSKLVPWVSEACPLTYHLLKKTLLQTCSLPVAERAARALDLAINMRQDQSVMESWGMIQNLLTIPDTDGSKKKCEISLSREILLRQLLPEVRTQIPEPYTMPLEDLIIATQHLTDSVKATKRVPAPTLPVSTLQQEEGREEEVNTITRRRPAPPNRMMLVDTGAIRSIFPASREDRKWEPDPAASLTAANGLPIHSYGTRPLSISILGRRYSWDFVIVDVRTPLLGADFLAHFGLAVDVGQKHLLDTDSCQSLPLSTGPMAPTICSAAPHQYSQLLTEFPDVFKPKLRQKSGVPVVPEDIPKTAIITPFRSYVFTFSTFGLRNAGATFQRLMDSILGDLNVQKADFLGHEVSPDGVHPLTSKVAAVTRFPVPTSIKAVQEFLGMPAAGLLLNEGRPRRGNRLSPPGSRRPPPADNGCQQHRLWCCPGDAWSSRQQRHLSVIAEFTCSLMYLPSRKNPVVDALSRVKLNAVQLGINYEDLAREQAADPETPAYRTAITSLKWRDVPLAPRGPNLLCDVSTGQPCPQVPASRRRQVFDIIDGLSHPSGRTTAKLLSEKFVWHGVQKDARTWVRQCLHCQTSKVGQHTESGVGEFLQPGRRFGHVHINVVGPLPPSGGSRYLLMVVDHSTRWPEATPMQEATASACAEVLLSS